MRTYRGCSDVGDVALPLDTSTIETRTAHNTVHSVQYEPPAGIFSNLKSSQLQVSLFNVYAPGYTLNQLCMHLATL